MRGEDMPKRNIRIGDKQQQTTKNPRKDRIRDLFSFRLYFAISISKIPFPLLLVPNIDRIPERGSLW